MLNNDKIKKLSHDILDQNFEKSLRDAELLGRLLWHNQTGIYELNALESSLIDFFCRYSNCKEFFNLNPSDNDLLFIATEVYLTGGHTRLMERLAKGKEGKCELLITRKQTPEVITRLARYFKGITIAPFTSIYKKKIEYICSIACNYKHIILNIHPDDISTVVACGVIRKLSPETKFYYINHADHVFSYGTSISDIWFQISSYGARIDELRNLSGKVSFLGIPIESKNINALDTKNNDFMTAGSSDKYKPVNEHSIFPLLNALLKRDKKANLYVIGPNFYRDYWWWPLKFKYPFRVKISKRIPFDKYMDVSKRSNIYIDSHPIPGGTAFAEQYMQGKICIGLISPFQGYTPVEYVKKRDIIDINNVRNNEVEIKIKKALKNIHGLNKVVERFDLAIYKGGVSPNLCDAFLPWSGDISYNWDKKIKNIPSNFPINSLVTKFALNNSTINAKLAYLLKHVSMKIIKVIFSKKR
ncbi:hypothetical protein ECSG_00546 [Escherichia coli B175]|uniref:hypothetical protein n=2 Tax=Escherichia coli TaxID=562 RepID=UPI000A186875|nr:hypothetical protein [Escherichia coli]OSL18626.1 hypothetical protein ECSG_00546 [Escherichia coli B175]